MDNLDSVSFQLKSAGVSALIGLAGIGIHYADINEFSKAVLGIAFAATVVFRAGVAFLDLKKKWKEDNKSNEQAND